MPGVSSGRMNCNTEGKEEKTGEAGVSVATLANRGS